MRRFLLLIPICLAAVAVTADEVHSKNGKGNRLYKKGHYAEALKQYDDALLLSPSDPALHANKGSALYKLGSPDKAEESYTSALNTEDKRRLADIHYNLGNSLYRQGEQLMSTGSPEAQQKFKSALDHYIQSLDLRQGDRDAKWNVQLTQQRIAQLKQDQDKQDQDKDKDQDKDQDKQDKDKQDNQDKKDKQDSQKNDKNENKDQQNQDQQQKNKENDKEEQQKQQQDQKGREDQKQEQQQSPQDMEKGEAARLIEQFADDGDSLNKPPKLGVGRRAQPEKDW